MKRKVTTITEEFDKDGKLTSKITETVEESDEGYIYPQYPTMPYCPEMMKITCDTLTGSPPTYRTTVTAESTP